MRRLGPDAFEIVDGHHRVRAAGEVGLAQVPALVVANMEDAKAVLAALGLNHIRGELNLTDAASQLCALHDTGFTVEQLMVTGFSGDEIADMLTVATPVTTEDLLAGADTDLPPTTAANPRSFAMTLEFETADQLKAVKRTLRKAAGRGQPLENGLLKLLAVD